MLLRLFSLAVLCTVLVGCSRSADETLSRHTNELLQNYLKGQTLELAPLKAGAQITLPDLVTVDSSVDGQCLSISFVRGDFDERFIRDLFYSKDPRKLRGLSPFTEPGIEAILTADHVVFNFYSGVVVHLQPDLMYPEMVTPFIAKQVNASVVKVIGSAAHTARTPLPEVLKTFLYLRDGKAFAFSSADKDKGKHGSQSEQIADATAKMSLTFMPTIMDRPIDPQALACNVKAFRG